jgi:hypothetical protein
MPIGFTGNRYRLNVRGCLAKFALSLAALSALFCREASAQQYRSDPVDAKASGHQSAARNYALDPTTNAADQPKFIEFFKNFFFPSLTRTDPTSLGQLTRSRDFLFSQVLQATRDKRVQEQLTGFSFGRLQPIVESQGQPPYHPAVRYNAVLMIGMLNDVYPNAGQEKPHSKATAFLVEVVNSATVNSNYPPSVVLGALIGLERHARLAATLPPKDVEAIASAALKIISHEERLPTLDREEQDWLRLRAASVLAQLGSPGNGNQHINAVLKLASGLAHIDDRCEAAALLGKFKLDGVQLDGAIVSEHLLKLTAAVTEVELARAIEFEASGRTSTGEGNGYPRRPLLAHLNGLKAGLVAVKPAVTADVQGKFDSIVTSLTSTIDVVTSRDAIDVTIVQRVRQMANELKALAPPQPATPAGGAVPQPVP